MIVVFDIGNVLIRWNPRNLYRKTFDDEAQMERFLATALNMDFVNHLDLAEDFGEAIEARAQAFPEFADEVRMFHDRWFETLGERIEENIALMRRLKKAGRPAHALSNFARDKFALSRDRYDFLNEFDTAIISGQVGAAKPDPRIYEILFKRVGKKPEELLFIDDVAANVKAARALGMETIHFTPGVDLEKELAARGALP
jgi:2-haloacid dehalogenase